MDWSCIRRHGRGQYWAVDEIVGGWVERPSSRSGSFSCGGYPAHGNVSKRESSITLWKNVSATYVGIVQRILRTYPNFVRRAISHFVRAHHGKFRQYRRSCKAPRKTPQIVLPFRCSLVWWLKHARACLFLCAGGCVGSICPLNFTMLC